MVAVQRMVQIQKVGLENVRGLLHWTAASASVRLRDSAHHKASKPVSIETRGAEVYEGSVKCTGAVVSNGAAALDDGAHTQQTILSSSPHPVILTHVIPSLGFPVGSLPCGVSYERHCEKTSCVMHCWIYLQVRSACRVMNAMLDRDFDRKVGVEHSKSRPIA